jgi:hypothetical protein
LHTQFLLPNHSVYTTIADSIHCYCIKLTIAGAVDSNTMPNTMLVWLSNHSVHHPITLSVHSDCIMSAITCAVNGDYTNVSEPRG